MYTLTSDQSQPKPSSARDESNLSDIPDNREQYRSGSNVQSETRIKEQNKKQKKLYHFQVSCKLVVAKTTSLYDMEGVSLICPCLGTSALLKRIAGSISSREEL